jgi:hypothetical protein
MRHVSRRSPAAGRVPGARFSRSAGLVALGLVLATGAFAETRVGGPISGQQRWTKAGAPYIVTKDITIPKGATLTVEPGVTVRFKSDIVDHAGTAPFDLEILVEGTLVARGAAGDTIYFTSDAVRRQWTDWAGIVVRGKGARAELEAVVIEMCITGIGLRDGAHLEARNVTVQFCEQAALSISQSTANVSSACIFRDVGNMGGTGVGIYVDRGSQVDIANSFVIGTQSGVEFARKSGGRVHHTVVSFCALRGMVVRNSNPEVTECTITNNPQGLILSAGAVPKVERNNIFDNETTNLVLAEYPAGVKIAVGANWWGTTELGLAEEMVLDALDDEKRGAFAVLEPILPEAVTFEARGGEKGGP